VYVLPHVNGHLRNIILIVVWYVFVASSMADFSRLLSNSSSLDRINSDRTSMLRLPCFLRAELNKNTDSGFSAGLVDESNPFEWQVILTGPPDTM
jgi:hypothetical protein